MYARGTLTLDGPLTPVCDELSSPIIALAMSYTSSFVPAYLSSGAYLA